MFLETVTFFPLLKMSEVYATMPVCLSEEPKNCVLQYVIRRHNCKHNVSHTRGLALSV
jgi:hypothetical protein